MKESLRTFIAICLSQEVKQQLTEIQKKLFHTQDSIKWVKADNVHLTLKFLGQVPRPEIIKIEKMISEITGKFDCFNLSVRGIGAFPQAGWPKIIWAGVEPDKKLEDIYQRLENGLVPLGFLKEERSFKPHLTIARIKNIFDKERFSADLNKFKETDFGNLPVARIVLFKSTLTPPGPVYEEIYSAALNKCFLGTG